MTTKKATHKTRKASARNEYKVPKQQWRTWPTLARLVFNEQFFIMNNNQFVFLHPQDKAVTARMWRTVAFNASWVAAEAVVNGLDHIIGE